MQEGSKIMTEITKKQECIFIRNGIEIWVDEDKAVQIKTDLLQGIANNFIKAGNRIINVKEIVGIFNPDDLEDLKRRKNGQWKCDYGEWHNRGENCGCHKSRLDKENERRIKEREEAGDVSEEERINNLKKIGNIRKDLFGKKKK